MSDVPEAAGADPASASGEVRTRQAPWPYVVFILTLISMFNYLDRQIVYILAEPIKLDLKLSDTQLGILTGFSFAVVYGLAAVPLARLAERGSRPLILGVSLAVWSSFTVLAGFTRNFWEFALTRLGVGLGEAGSSPPAHALIVDVAPERRRALALGFYQAGVPLGTLMGMVVGGVLADWLGWRMALICAGAPGLLLAIVTLATIPEPRRGRPRTAVRSSFLSDARTIFKQRSFLLMMVGGAFITAMSFGVQAFLASFYFRSHAAEVESAAASLGQLIGADVGPVAFIGSTLGILTGVAGIAGTLVGGAMADRWASRTPQNYALLTAIPQLAAAPALLAGIIWPDLGGSLFFQTLRTFLISLSIAPTWAAVQAIATDATRATAVALGFLITTVGGLGFGPLFVGIVSDALNATGMPSADALRWSLTSSVGLTLIGAAIAWSTRVHLRNEAKSIGG